MAVLAGCGGGGGPRSAADGTGATSSDATTGAANSTGSALGGTDAATYDASQRELADLLIGPRAVGQYRLVLVKVDDPNHDGRVDGRWYPPRVLSESCQVRADNAPIPGAAAAFIPGDPNTPVSANSQTASTDMFEAPRSIGVQIQLFDDSSQRDSFANMMEDLYRAMSALKPGSSQCGVGASGGSAIAELKETTAHATGYPGYAVKGRLVIAPVAVIHYRVGERVLLTVTLQLGVATLKDLKSTTEIDTRLVEPVIDAQIERLKSKGLG
jgi:hypothetical protein